MKLSSTFSLCSLTLAAVLLLGSCSKKDDATPSTGTGTGTTTGTTTYATTWTADSKNYTATTSSGAVNGSTLMLNLAQTVSSSESYSVILNVPAATGTYTIGTGTNIAGYTTITAGTTTGYVAGNGIGSGTVVVTTLSSTEIIGTFTFTGMAANASATTKAVTNGKFAIKR